MHRGCSKCVGATVNSGNALGRLKRWNRLKGWGGTVGPHGRAGAAGMQHGMEASIRE